MSGGAPKHWVLHAERLRAFKASRGGQRQYGGGGTYKVLVVQWPPMGEGQISQLQGERSMEVCRGLGERRGQG